MFNLKIRWNEIRKTTLVLVFLPLLVFIALVYLLFSSFFMREAGIISDPGQVPSVLINKPAPSFELPTLASLGENRVNTKVFSTVDLHGKLSIVNVWASWCAPCRLEHPILMDISKDHRIQVLGLNYKDKFKNATEFLNELGNPYDIVGFDKNGRVGIEWGVYGIPETFVVDSNGIIRYKFIGPLTNEKFESVFLPNLEKVISMENF